MIRQSTIDKLHEMRLSAMADAFESQCADPDTYQGLSFEDRFGMLVDKYKVIIMNVQKVWNKNVHML